MTDKLIQFRIKRALKPLRHSGNMYNVSVRISDHHPNLFGSSAKYVVTYPKYFSGEAVADRLWEAGLEAENNKAGYIEIFGLGPTLYEREHPKSRPWTPEEREAMARAAKDRATAKAAAKAAEKRPRYGGIPLEEFEDKEEAARGSNPAASIGDPSNGDAQ